ncbi:putative glycosyltransferase [Methanocella paludicola SANAE]|uniref:Glycosyltransferase n=1 Tax=Methanocella paludicola (strain DSM 17711 / JCM 13418 / NBRC 101707 / SANAE) TaxID=304371 RepID=D1Z181_METPS|nr:glycosyltransferase family 4 protein [Methanocella paludicola]BAI62453.1 putative glycosyltransferase [Methanocella paludicola SANAE]
MEKLKIAFFCWESIYSEKIGGLSPGATYLAETLAKEHEVHFFTRGRIEEKEIKGVNYHYCWPSANNIVDYCKNMSDRMVERFREYDSPPFDILHFHDWHVVEAMHQLKDRNTVFTYHSTEFGRIGGRFGDWWESREIAGKEWYGGLIAKRCTAVSQTLKNEVMWLYKVPGDKIGVVNNGIFPEVYDAMIDAGEVKKSYGIHPLAPLVFFIGRMEYQKGPDMLVDAMPMVVANKWGAQFIMAGEGSMKHQLEEQARRMGLPVRFLGYIPDSEYVRLLHASDVIVIPSRNEPFGLVLLEAWSAKRPVVACDVGGLAENIDNFVNGVKVHQNPESIAWGINYILNGGNGVAGYGWNGWKKIDRMFRWDVSARKMLDIYKKVLQ